MSRYSLPMQTPVLDKGHVAITRTLPCEHDAVSMDHAIAQVARASTAYVTDGLWTPQTGLKGPVDDEKLVRFLWGNRHVSPFAVGATLQLHVKAPDFVFRQWERHWSWAYLPHDQDLEWLASEDPQEMNAMSARYQEMPDEFYIPLSFRGQAKRNRQASAGDLDTPAQDAARAIWENAIAHGYGSYQALLEIGNAREQARALLPFAVYVEFYAVTSLRNLLFFLLSRDSPHAQWETRCYAIALRQLLRQIAPLTHDLAFGLTDGLRAA